MTNHTGDHDHNVQDLVDIEQSPLSSVQVRRIINNPRILSFYRNKLKDAFYPQLFLALTHEKFTTEEATALWHQVSQHREYLTQVLARDPGFMVALLDHLENFSGFDISPVLIDANLSHDMLDESTRDTLTGLFRRNVFDQMLEQEFAESQRKPASFIVLMMDIDDFKQVNDTWGHQTGDKVLSALGGLLNAKVRAMDIAARYGGEELVILMPDTDLTSGFEVAQRLRKAIAGLEFSEFHITASFGIADSAYDSASKILEAADSALYKAKGAGKNCVKVAQSKS